MAEEMDLVKISFKVKGLETDFHVQSMSGTESISQLFHFKLVLAAKEAVKFADVVGKKATMTMRRVSDTDLKDIYTRYIHGIVGGFQRVKKDVSGDAHVYQALLVPDVAKMLHRSDCRIFQNKPLEDVVKEVLAPYISTNQYIFGPTRKVPPMPRDYCVQYCESDWHFVERLLEEEGYYYFIDHGKEHETLIMVGRANLKWPISPKETDGEGEPPPPRVPFQPPSGQQPDRETIQELSFGSQICPGQQQLDDYFFQQQQKSPSSTCTDKPGGPLKDYIPANKKLEQYEYPGIYEPEEQKFLTKADKLTESMAKVRLQEQRVRALQGEGRSNCLGFMAGGCFALQTMDLEDDFDKTKLMLTQVHHRAESSKNLMRGDGPEQSHCTYDNSFSCVPLDLPYRPPRRTPKPAIHGVQTAVVVGPGKEEIYTDKYGRVKVMFRWDRQAHAKQKKNESVADCSCWIRVSQPWAGVRWGAMFLPRVGHEVLVSFENGDPDRPIITGSVYHETNPTPYELPKHKTRSTIKSNSSPDAKGRRSNEIRFEDKKGAEQVYIHAQLNMDEVVGHNHTRTVRKDEKITIKKGDRQIDVLKGDQSVGIMEGSLRTDIGKDNTETVQRHKKTVVTEGEMETKVLKGDHRLMVKMDSQEKVESGNKTFEIDEGGYYIHVKKKHLRFFVHEGDHSLRVKKGKLKISVGQSSLEMKNDGTIEIKGPGGKISIGASGIQVKAGAGKSVKVEGLPVELN